MPMENQHEGRCFCGAVEVRVEGKPAAMGYCHCASCREWSASPMNAFTLWAPSAVTITRGLEHVASFSKNPTSVRKWCRKCGSHILTEHPLWGVTDVFAAVIPDLPFVPGVHVNYGEKVLAMRDGLPKQKDFPKEMGGSGTVLPE